VAQLFSLGIMRTMAEIDIDKIAEIHRQIDSVLLHDWDPIGVGHVPECFNEYSRYVRGVYDVAVETRSARAVAEHLVKMERGHMGLSGWRRWKTRLPVAQKILNLVSDVGPLT
jgi:hypothetical protein